MTLPSELEFVPTRGFLPAEDPMSELPEGADPALAAWNDLGRNLSKWLLTPHLRTAIHDLPPFPSHKLASDAERWRAASLLAYATSLYLIGPPIGNRPLRQIPAVLAVPLVELTTQLGVPPILSYGLQSIYNWRRLDRAGPLEAHNLTLLQNFLGGMDEEWFVTLHIEIEAAAAPALQALVLAQDAVTQHDDAALVIHLETISRTLDKMHAILGRMQERCDPYIYYHRVRPFMFGWKDNPDLPGGVLYEGVERFGGKPVEFRGETGAQSSIVPAIDATLGIEHERDEMRVYLIEMFDYMPPAHRHFIAQRAAGPSLRSYVQTEMGAKPALREAYNGAVESLTRFRTRHIEYAALYILKPAKTEEAVGTGGTPFTFYLKKHIAETKRHFSFSDQ